jgi:hypothetical protein
VSSQTTKHNSKFEIDVIKILTHARKQADTGPTARTTPGTILQR